MKKPVVMTLTLVGGVVVLMFTMGTYSRIASPPAPSENQLSPCPANPACVSSEAAPNDSHAIAALVMEGPLLEEPLLLLKEVVEDLGGKVVRTTEGYMATTFESTIFGFVDDVEFRIDASNRVVHVRSASRVGYYDFDVNRERVERIRERVNARLDTD